MQDALMAPAVTGSGTLEMDFRAAPVWLDLALSDAHANPRFDEELLAQGKSVLRVWETPSECVVLGYAGRPERDVFIQECRWTGIPVLKRCSGGGAVLLGPGCLNYALVLPPASDPKLRDVRYSLQWVMSRMRRALAVPHLRVEGQCDLALHQRKVSGSAQRRTHSAILHHGTLLYNFDAARTERFLKPPIREPHYRAGRAHRDFMGNLPLTAEEIKRRLVKAWC